jgi:hypothetical protein
MAPKEIFARLCRATLMRFLGKQPNNHLQIQQARRLRVARQRRALKTNINILATNVLTLWVILPK